MALILTRQFGTIDVDENAMVEFPAGLPGFENETRFALIDRAPLVFLQSLNRHELCFLTVPAAAIDPDYEIAMTGDDARVLGLSESSPGAELMCLAIVSAAESGPATANLLAPVVIERRFRRGIQAVRFDRRYSHQHRLGGAGCS
jgi:flagellar assembly factor FliW